jgi:hypothetical protein
LYYKIKGFYAIAEPKINNNPPKIIFGGGDVVRIFILDYSIFGYAVLPLLFIVSALMFI